MKTIKEITELLNKTSTYEDWMNEIEMDERKGVQKVWKQWKRRIEKQQKLLENHLQKITFDQSFAPFKGALIAGIDEAGRGPLAGPVVTAAVILPQNCNNLVGVDDSKQLSRKQRHYFAERIKQYAIDYVIHFQSVKVIDEINIYEATKQSMASCIRQLTVKPHVCLIDAMEIPLAIPQHSLIKGDAKSLSIGAASILAKDARDAYMDSLHEQYPAYGFNKNAGYGTKQHIEALQKYGIIDEHRRSFEPIKSIINKGESKNDYYILQSDSGATFHNSTKSTPNH